MFYRSICLLIITTMLASGVSGQVINNFLAYKNISSDSYFRFCYDNDFFAAIDEYYTQGIDVELVSPRLERFPANKLLLRPKFSCTRYGVGAQHNGYTPSSISSDNILYNDHPFAGCLLLKTFLISIDPEKQQRFSSAIYAGVIGPLAGTKEMQEGIHRGLGNIMPHGWQYQVSNDLALNYHVDYEKQLLSHGRYFSFSGSGSIDLGTLNCKAGIGATLMGGYFTFPFSNAIQTRRDISIYAYERPEVSFTGYDAMLQGGMFNRSSPYTLKDNEITRLTFRNRLGIVVAYGGVYLEFFSAVLTKEFNAGKQHGYGGVQVAVSF